MEFKSFIKPTKWRIIVTLIIIIITLLSLLLIPKTCLCGFSKNCPPGQKSHGSILECKCVCTPDENIMFSLLLEIFSILSLITIFSYLISCIVCTLIQNHIRM